MLLLGINILIAASIAFVIQHFQSQSPTTAPATSSAPTSEAPSPTSLNSPGFMSDYDLNPVITTTHWLSWALLDMKSKTVVGSQNFDKPSYLMSTIKPWIAADYLNRHPNPSSSILVKLSRMIRDSDDQVAYSFFDGKESLDRLTKRCGLTDIVYVNWSWSLTQMSARDMVKYGACIYTGKATNAKWTDWIVDKMRHVRGDGDFGPRQLFQDRTQIATKNGWFFWEGKWYVNCLAVTGDWAISIIQQWPYSGGSFKYGISLANSNCKIIANQVLKLNA